MAASAVAAPLERANGWAGDHQAQAVSAAGRDRAVCRRSSPPRPARLE
jgi:hypothetical protein